MTLRIFTLFLDVVSLTAFSQQLYTKSFIHVVTIMLFTLHCSGPAFFHRLVAASHKI